MANLAASNKQEWDNALHSFESDIIKVDLTTLGNKIAELISDVGLLHTVTIGDLKVFGAANGGTVQDVADALSYGTKFFDAMYYFAVPATQRPAIVAGTRNSTTLAADILMVKKRLLWTAIFLMLRGSYPTSASSALGTDIPAFLVNICGMNESPAICAAGLASFPLVSIKADWVKSIDWKTFAPEIKQRLALGLAGYRQLGPFKLYNVQATASADVVAAFNWVRAVATLPPSYDILSATRSAALISRMGSWNKALGNLMLLAFTDAELQEMVTNKIIYAKPVRDPRADTWRSWVASGVLASTNPIGL